MGWIGVDLDGTLAIYPPENGESIGSPIAPMVNRIKKWLFDGKQVRIVTARVGCPIWSSRLDREEIDAIINTQRDLIEDWLREHIGCILPVVCSKDYEMIELWDDRAVRVIENTGKVDNNFTREY